MMKRIKVWRKGAVDPNLCVAEASEADAWLASCLAKNKFGLPERPELDAEGNPTGVILPAEYTIVEEDITDEVEQQKVNQQSLAYLASTDWYVIRLQETGQPIPQEILDQRAAARAAIVR